MGLEQRRHPRHVLHVRFTGRGQGGLGELHFHGADLSVGGSFLQSDLLLEQGERLQLVFQVPGVPRPMRCDATVAWVRRFPEARQPGGMGVEFVQMPEADRLMLAEYLRSA